MPFAVSPGVNVTEIDLTTVVPAVSTTEGAIGGVFRWGPLEKYLLIDSEDTLIFRYGKPTILNPETWFTAADFLAYGNKLYVVRAGHVTGNSFVFTAEMTNGNANVTISNNETGIVQGDAIYGSGIEEGTVVSTVTIVGDNTVITMSNEATESANNELNFFDVGYCFNAIANTNNATMANQIVKNEDHYEHVTFDTDVQWVAKYPGVIGNSLRISVCDSTNAYYESLSLNTYDTTNAVGSISFTVGSNSATITISNTASGNADTSETVALSILGDISLGDYIKVGNTAYGYQYLKLTSIGTPSTTGGNSSITLAFSDRYTLAGDFSTNTIYRYWEFFDNVDTAPGQSQYQLQFGNTSANDEIHVVVVDEDGLFSGVPGTVLEVYQALSRATDSKTFDGSTNYYKDVINQNSLYVWWAHDRSGAASAVSANLTSSTNDAAYNVNFVGGRDTLSESSISIAKIISAYDYFKSAEEIDISLLLTGKARGGINGEQLANYLIDNIAEKRMDCVVFCSPDKADVVNNTSGDIEQDIVSFRNALRSTSYAVLDSGYKYRYDRYNDVYRYTPLNGDIAGLCVRTDENRDAWWSPAGFNRGHIKNLVKLAWNPKKAQRDILYKSGINPVVNFPGQGIILYGDKTLLAKPSAFDRINVRRLFIVLEKAISTAAKYTLFEFNDEFTRSSFVNLVTPFLRDVQGRRGIYDFKVVCDETNNTGEVIDRNEFVGDIYVKPSKSINYINLNFIAVRTGVEFNEVVGKF